MALNITDAGKATRLVLDGRLDAAGVAQVELAFTAAASGAARDVIVDLGAVDFVASLGLRMFISAARVVQRRGRVIVLYAARPAVAEVLATVALGQLIPVTADEAAALALLP